MPPPPPPPPPFPRYLLAYTYPFSYTNMKYHLADLLSSPRTSRHMRRALLCKSEAGHECDVITIADFASTENKDTGAFGVEEQHLISQASNKRKCVVISARVHPGEVGASWMMKGLLDFLTSESEQVSRSGPRFRPLLPLTPPAPRYRPPC